MSDTEKLSHLMRLKHHEALNFTEKDWDKRRSIVLHMFDLMKTLFDVYVIFMWIVFVSVPIILSVCIYMFRIKCFCLSCNA